VPFGETAPYEKDSLLYDNNGDLIKQITIDNSGNESRRNEYEYKNHLIVLEKYFLAGNLNVIIKYKYDDKNRLIAQERTFKNDPDGKWLYKYDDNNNIIEFSIITPEGKVSITQKIKYDAYNCMIEMAAYGETGTLDQLYKTQYDKDHLIVQEESFTSIQKGDLKNADYKKTIYKYIIN